MNSTKIHELLKKRCGRTFLGVFSIDRLPLKLPSRRPLLLVRNTDPHDKPGEHWVVLYIDIVGQYFASFAQETPRTFQHYLQKHWEKERKKEGLTSVSPSRDDVGD